MTPAEIEKKVQELLGFEALGFYEFKNADRVSEMRKKVGDAICVFSYSLFPPMGRSELYFNNMVHYDIIFPGVSRILMNVVNDGNYTTSHGTRMGVNPDDVRFTDSPDNRELRWEIQREGGLILIIEDNIFYEDRLIAACALYKQVLEQFALPFFDKYTSLQAVNDEIIDIPVLELYKRISGHNSLTRMIIMKLCNAPACDEITDAFGKRLKEVIEKDETEYQSYYDCFLALRTYLESGKYLQAENEPLKEFKPETIVHTPPPVKPLPENDKLQQQFTAQKAVLESIGITFDDQFSLDDYRRDMNWESWGMESMEDDEFLYYLLLFAGTEVNNPVKNDYEAVSRDIWYFNAETDGFVSYGEIMERLNLLTSHSLALTDVVSRFEPDYAGVSFKYKGVAYEWEFEIQNDWVDMRIMGRFMELINADLDAVFYIMEEGQGGLIFYLTPERKAAFEQVFPGKKLFPLRDY